MNLSRMPVLLTCLALGSLVLAGVTMDYDSEGRFSEYRTYAWARGTSASDIVQKQIVRAVEAELAVKGFEKVQEAPDVFVITHAGIHPEQRVDVNDYGYRRRIGLGTTTVNIYNIQVGTLVVDILDGESKILVWRGVVTATVSDKPEKSEKKINKAVTKLFQNYPPPAGK